MALTTRSGGPNVAGNAGQDPEQGACRGSFRIPGKSRYPDRNRTIFLLSLKAGLRAKEIASLTWEMITDADGEVGQAMHLQDKPGAFVISSERSPRVSPQLAVNMFSRWYDELGFNGCSSHSGRRTFIMSAARKISTVCGSLRDLQILAGHTNLRTTQRYIEADTDAQKRVLQQL
jgi:integrase/recombinase XerD